MDSAPPAPRGRMTDRYTVWAGSIFRAGGDSVNGTPASKGTDAPAESMSSVQATPPGSASSGTSGATVDQPPIALSERIISRSAGSDLAMSRLQTATGGSTSSAQAPATALDATAGDAAGLGAAEEALDDAVERFLVSAQAVEASIGNADLSDDTGAGVPSEPDVTRDADGSITSSPAGLAGLMDDLSGHATTVPDQVTHANARRQTHVSEHSGAVTEQKDATFREGRERTTEAAQRVEIASDRAGTEPRYAGSDRAGAIREDGETPRDEIAGVGIHGATGGRTAGANSADTVDDGLNRGGDRREHTVDDVEPTSMAAAGETSGAIAGTGGDLRHHLTSPARHLLSIGQDFGDDTGTVTAETADDLRSPVPERTGIVAGSDRVNAGGDADRAGQSTQSVTGAASEARAGTAGTVRDGSGGDPLARDPLPPRPYYRLIVAAVALGTVSGFNRWAVRRLTGANVALLGPATVHPAILGTGLATLIASLYLVDDQSSPASEAESMIRSGR